MLIDPEINAASVVLIGNLNPKIFSPDWLARHNLITGAQADAAEVALVHPSLSNFRIEWFTVTVETDKFQISSTEQPFVRLRDLVIRIFRELLPHTPLAKLGINREAHFNVGSQEVREQMGRRLAPPQAWGEWCARITAGEGERHGGLRSIQMEERDLDDRVRGYVSATVQPSLRIPGNAGVYIAINDHYEISDVSKPKDAGEMINKLTENWDKSMRKSEHIMDQVMRLRHA